MKWKFKENLNQVGGSDGFWYDLTNGYIKPENLLNDAKQIESVNKAIALLQDFENSLTENDLLNEF